MLRASQQVPSLRYPIAIAPRELAAFVHFNTPLLSLAHNSSVLWNKYSASRVISTASASITLQRLHNLVLLLEHHKSITNYHIKSSNVA